jgi:hypothetical protein
MTYMCSGMRWVAVALLTLLCSLPMRLMAQAGNQGTITITVADATGAAVPGAKLELVENRSNSPRNAASDGKGLYSFVNLNVGS